MNRPFYLCLLLPLALWTGAAQAQPFVPLALWTGAAQAQPFVVESAQPADGQAGVPLDAVVRFEFTEEVSVSTNWNETVRVEPAVAVESVALLLDGDGTPAVVEFAVQHEPDTDYSWVVYGVERSGGGTMAAPHALRYSTAASMGTGSVSGSVAAARPAGAESFAPPVRESLRRLARFFTDTERGRLPFEPLTGDVAAPADAPTLAATVPVASRQGGADFTYVLLLRDYTAAEPDWSVAATTAIGGASGPFAVDHVRDGTYWPVAVRFADPAAGVIEAFGFHDSDGDGSPDAVSVVGGTVSEVGISLFGFEPTTAQTFEAEATAAAATVVDAPVLKMIAADYGIDPSGAAYTWVYRYVAGDGSATATVTADPLALVAEAGPPSTLLSDMAPLPEGYVDSHVALETALANGGSAFLDAHAGDDVATVLEGGNLYWAVDPPRDDAFWRVQLVAVSASGSERFTALVDMTDGVILSGEEAAAAATPRLGANYPNPFAASTTLPVHLAEAGRVTLTVYDVLGRRVATPLHDAVLPAGEHAVRWEAGGLASGVYVVRLQAEGAVAQRTVTLQR